MKFRDDISMAIPLIKCLAAAAAVFAPMCAKWPTKKIVPEAIEAGSFSFNLTC